MTNKVYEEYLSKCTKIDVTNLNEVLTKTYGKNSITMYEDITTNKKYYICDSGHPYLDYFEEDQLPDSFVIYSPYLMKMSDMDENAVYSNPDTMESEDGACIGFAREGACIDFHCQFIIEVWYGVHDFTKHFDEVAENITYHTGNLTMKEIKDKFISAGLKFNGYEEHCNNDD